MSRANKQTVINGKGRVSTGQIAKGNLGGPGRPKGSPDKVSAMLKEGIRAAYAEWGEIELAAKPGRPTFRSIA